MVFPTPATKLGEESITIKVGECDRRTFAIDPQHRTVLLPFAECTALDKPSCGPTLLDFTCATMIDGVIWRREPCSKSGYQASPYVFRNTMVKKKSAQRRSAQKTLRTASIRSHVIVHTAHNTLHLCLAIHRERVQLEKRTLNILSSRQPLQKFF